MDRIGDSARKGLDFLKSRATETIEVQRLSALLRQLEERRQRCLVDLGHRVMAGLEIEELRTEMFEDRADEVHYLNEQIEQLKKRQDELRHHQRPGEEDTEANAAHSVPPPDYETL